MLRPGHGFGFHFFCQSKCIILAQARWGWSEGYVNSNNIRFWIESDPLGNNSSISGYFISTDYQFNGNTITAKFTHPKYLPSNYLPSRPDKIRIVDYTNPGATLYSIPIAIYRAPVLFMHGFAGNASTFSSMSQELVSFSHYYPQELNTIADYNSTAKEGFETNAKVVALWIQQAFYNSLSGKYSAGKVDIVCHSMGGILSRLYLQNNYGNKYKGEVNKLITINTPHSGSHLANYLVFHPLNIALCTSSPVFHKLSFTCNGAGVDMQTYSYATDNILNSPNSLLLGHVPSHTISSYISNPDAVDCIGSVPPFNPVIVAFLGINALTIPIIFQSLNHKMDGVVRDDSQKAGLSSSQTSPIIYQCHIGAAANSSNINEVKQLLCASPSGGQFALNGFSPPDLFVDFPETRHFQEPLQIKSPSISGNIDILSPTNSDSFIPNESIAISIVSDAAIKRLLILVGNASIGITFLDSLITSTSNTLEYTIPATAIGQIEIDAIGFDAENNVIASDSTTFNVIGNATLTSLEINPRAILVPTSLQTSFQVIGHYSDSISRDITLVDGVQFGITNPEISKVLFPGVIEGTTIDSTLLTISYDGLSDTVPYPSDQLHLS